MKSSRWLRVFPTHRNPTLAIDYLQMKRLCREKSVPYLRGVKRDSDEPLYLREKTMCVQVQV